MTKISSIEQLLAVDVWGLSLVGTHLAMARRGDDGIAPHRFCEGLAIPLELEFPAPRGGGAPDGGPSGANVDTDSIRFGLPLQCLSRLRMDAEVSDFLCNRLLSPVFEAVGDQQEAVIGVVAPFNISHGVRDCLSRRLAARFCKVHWVPCEVLAVLLYLGEQRPADFDEVLANGGQVQLVYSDGHNCYRIDSAVREERLRNSQVPAATISVRGSALRRSARTRAASEPHNGLHETLQDSGLCGERPACPIAVALDSDCDAMVSLTPAQLAAGAAIYAGMFCGRGTTRRCYMYPLGRYVGIRVGESSFFALVKPGTRWPVRREIELVLQTRGGAAQATVLEAFTPEVASAAEVGHLRVEGLPRRGGRECRGLLCLDVDRLGRAQAMMAVEGVESVAELSFGLGPYSCAGERLS